MVGDFGLRSLGGIDRFSFKLRDERHGAFHGVVHDLLGEMFAEVLFQFFRDELGGVLKGSLASFDATALGLFVGGLLGTSFFVDMGSNFKTDGNKLLEDFSDAPVNDSSSKVFHTISGSTFGTLEEFLTLL